MKWSYSLHATGKKDAQAKVKAPAQSSSCPVTDLIVKAIDSLPGDRPITVSTHGELPEPQTKRKKQAQEEPIAGSINISIEMPL